MAHYLGDSCPGGHKEMMGQYTTANIKKALSEFVVKDSGERQHFDGGMQRDVNTDKTLWHLVLDGPLVRRLAEHLTKGARKYTARNWMKAAGQEEYDRFRESAFRHFIQWWQGDTDEDHFAAVVFNMNGAEYVTETMIPTLVKSDDTP